jgi:hypothetical protein
MPILKMSNTEMLSIESKYMKASRLKIKDQFAERQSLLLKYRLEKIQIPVRAGPHSEFGFLIEML